MLDGAACRTSPNAPFRRCRRAFFSPPNQRDDPRLRISKDPPHGLQRTKAGKSIGVRQTADLGCSWHPQIMPKSGCLEMPAIALQTRSSATQALQITHTNPRRALIGSALFDLANNYEEEGAAALAYTSVDTAIAGALSSTGIGIALGAAYSYTGGSRTVVKGFSNLAAIQTCNALEGISIPHIP